MSLYESRKTSCAHCVASPGRTKRPGGSNSTGALKAFPGRTSEVRNPLGRPYTRTVFTLPTSTPPALALLVELLDDDRAAGLDWQAEQFAYTAWLACREAGAGRAWLRAIIDTTPAWRDAYQDRVSGAVERWDIRSLVD